MGLVSVSRFAVENYYKDENIFEHSKQQALAVFATCVLKEENRNMLLSKIYIKGYRYYLSRCNSKFSRGPRNFSNFNHQIHHHSCLTDISRSIHNVNKQREWDEC